MLKRIVVLGKQVIDRVRLSESISIFLRRVFWMYMLFSIVLYALTFGCLAVFFLSNYYAGGFDISAYFVPDNTPTMRNLPRLVLRVIVACYMWLFKFPDLNQILNKDSICEESLQSNLEDFLPGGAYDLFSDV